MQGNLAVLVGLLAGPQGFPARVIHLAAQSGRFLVLVKADARDRGCVAFEGKKTVESAPQAVAANRQDDLLDVYAEPSVFGKSGGGDIITNKKTFLLISALNSKNHNHVSIVKEWIAKSEFNKDEKIKVITNIFNELKLKELTAEQIGHFFRKGLEAFEKVPVPDNRKTELRNLVSGLLKRQK